VAVALAHGAHHAAPARPSGPWWKVAICEEGGRDNPTYGYLGIYPQSWRAYGGGRYAPVAGRASWRQQVTVANRIDRGYVPDQHGCAGGW